MKRFSGVGYTSVRASLGFRVVCAGSRHYHPTRRLAQAVAAVDTTTTARDAEDADETPELKLRFQAWGDVLMKANRRDAHCTAGETGASSSSAAIVVESYQQLKALLEPCGGAAEAKQMKLFLCGSFVTQRHVSTHSDLDFVLLPSGETTVPDRSVQLANLDAAHKAILRVTPTYMRHSLLQIKTARTPVVKFRFAHEAPTRARAAPPPLNAAPDGDRRELNESVAPAVSGSRFTPLSAGDQETLSRTVLVHLRGVEASADRVREAITKAGLEGRVTLVDVRFPVSDVFSHPLGFDVADEQGLVAQTERTVLSNSVQSTLLVLRGATATDALLAMAMFPDGTVLPKVKRDHVTTDFADRRYIPALFRAQWDISFVGFGIVNSYLLRYYLTGNKSPKWVQHGSLAFKRWGRCTHVTNAQNGMLTSYAITILWVYYLLVTHQLEWVDPASLPAAATLPMIPPAVSGSVPEALSDPKDCEALGRNVAWFFRFLAGGAADKGFDADIEVASLNRPRRSTRGDLVGWELHPTHGPRPGFVLCIEDPYEMKSDNAQLGGLNLGRHLDQERLAFILAKARRALCSIVQHNPSNEAADGTLLGSRIDDDAPEVTE